MTIRTAKRVRYLIYRYRGPFLEGYLWWDNDTVRGKLQHRVRRVVCGIVGHVPYSELTWKRGCRRCGHRFPGEEPSRA